jgi:peptidoglycan/LPS O-acetylase OafA/YrhL
MSSTEPRIPALDTLRGLAVLLVMWGHTTVMKPACEVDRVYKLITQSGWIGVDLFFVLSGFLITGILLDTRGKRGWLWSFFARRALRILPLAFAVILLVCVVVPNLPRATAQPWATLQGICDSPARHQGWLWSFLGNVQIARGGWCFGPLDAMWSLAVEEQFYLLWPLAVLWLNRRGILWLSGGLFALSIALKAILLARGVTIDAIIVLTPTRLDGLAIGAMIACAQREGSLASILPWAKRAVVALPFALVSLGLLRGNFTLTDPWVLSAGVPLVAIFFGAIVVVGITRPAVGEREPAANNAHRPNSITRFLAFTGKYSYALYLLHWPAHAIVMYAFFRIDDVPTVLGSRLPGALLYYAASWSAAYFLALFSWWALESRFLALKRFVPRPA